MGNHTVGREMGRMAEQLVARRKTEERALSLLDLICEPHRETDAEFEAEDPKRPGFIHPDYESYTDPEAPLGRLMIEAFAPHGLADLERYRKAFEDDETDCWWEEVYEPFRARYGFF